MFEIHNLDLPFLSPSLMNSYQRSYYLSYDKKYRITVDNNLLFYSINPISNYFKTLTDEYKVVIESKYAKKKPKPKYGFLECYKATVKEEGGAKYISALLVTDSIKSKFFWGKGKSV